MTIWIEIHCDARKDGQNPKDILRPRCRTNENANPAGMAKTKSSINAVLKYISDQATVQGWIYSNGKWTCPGCRNG